MPIKATMAGPSSVYYGPSSTNYTSVGSVSLNESVDVYGIESNWFYIEYSAGSLKKRGFVPYSMLKNPQGISVPTRSYSGGIDSVKSATNVYTGPSATVYAAAGSLDATETLTNLGEVVGSFTYVEYCTASGTKRGYVYSSSLKGTRRGILGVVTKSTSVTVYSGPSTTDYFVCGSVSTGEIVVLLEKGNNSAYPNAWYSIEYNTASGRKRGFVPQSAISAISSGSIPALPAAVGFSKARTNLTVLYGPNSTYPAIGSISQNEVVTQIYTYTTESTYAYIEYSFSGGKKRGYVAAASLIEADIDIGILSDAASVLYGPSSDVYAVVGSVSAGEDVQVHGYEDGYFFVEYPTATMNKRGFIPSAVVENAAALIAKLPQRKYTGWMDQVSANATVYTGPGTSYAVAGTVYQGEGKLRCDSVTVDKLLKIIRNNSDKQVYVTKGNGKYYAVALCVLRSNKPHPPSLAFACVY